MKNNKGITLTALVITVIALAILASLAAYGAIETISYTKENKFISELKIIREKANIINKEIALGSTAYNDAGKEILELTANLQTEIQTIFNSCEISVEEQENYKYFDVAELEKIGIHGVDHDVLINFYNISVISIEGFTKNEVICYTINQINEQE